MHERVRVIERETLSENWGKLRRTTLELQLSTGEWQRQVRETYDRGDGAAVLLHDPDRDTVLLVRQFRFPAFENSDVPFLIEVPAGKLEGDDPERCARKEVEEETGFRADALEQVPGGYSSPGSVTERLTLFLGEYHAGARVAAGGGLAHEGEDIEILELGFDAAMAMVASGEIVDLKTIVLLQHLALRRRA
jgi:GDP-mannose pyrophosphatase NudK